MWCKTVARSAHGLFSVGGKSLSYGTPNKLLPAKALLVEHSLGNLQLLHCLNNVFGHETLSKIKSLMAIAAPLAGSPQVRDAVCGGAHAGRAEAALQPCAWANAPLRAHKLSARSNTPSSRLLNSGTAILKAVFERSTARDGTALKSPPITASAVSKAFSKAAPICAARHAASPCVPCTLIMVTTR
jgi:hypothetical protein